MLFACGIILRFYDFWNWSLTNDELSTIVRLRYNSISDLINYGINTDVHPAFMQLFLYGWTKVFGDSAFSVRLPSVLTGVGSLFFIYFITLKWFNKNSATLALAISATLFPFVMYSQIARPYSMGLFLVLGFTYYWIKFQNKQVSRRASLGFIFFGLLALLTHYFSGFSIFIMLFIGLFIVPKSSIGKYLLSGLAIGVLFLPHLNITLNHLSIVGLSWIPVPESGYIFRYIDYVFNSLSWFKYLVFFLPFLALFSSGFYYKRKIQIILFLLFISPYWVAYFYSIHLVPILQFSVLIFSLPFLIFFLVSFVSVKANPNIIKTYSLVLVLVGLYALLYKVQIYQKKQFADFGEVAKKITEWTDKFGRDNILIFTNGNNPAYLSYYLNQYENPVEAEISHFDSIPNLIRARDLIDNSQKEYVLLAFASGPVPAVIHERVKQSYPFVVNKSRQFNSEAILYKRSEQKRDYLFQTDYKEFEINDKWRVYRPQLNDSVYHTKYPSYKLDGSVEYAITYRDSIKNLITDKNRFITASAWFMAKTINSAKLVISINYNGDELHWQSIELKDYLKSGEWAQVLDVIEISKSIPENAEVSFFFWNPNNDEMYIDDFKITNFTDSDYNYYDFLR